jgi:hypothetical protein
MLRFKERINCGMALESGCCRPSPPDLIDNCEMDSEYYGIVSLSNWLQRKELVMELNRLEMLPLWR